MMKNSCGFSDYFLDHLRGGTFDAECCCRMAGYLAQGSCYITGKPLEKGYREMHHRQRRFYGGKDTAQNTILLGKAVHRLVHTGNPYEARDLMHELKLTDMQLNLVNQLCFEAHMPLLKWKRRANHLAA